MKIAIVCDWLVTYAGAERVLSELLNCFPQADLFSVIDFFSSADRALIHNKKATTTFVQKLPFAKKLYRSYLPFMPQAIEQLNVSEYDLIISNSHAVAKGVITGPDQVHISYVQSPMRYAWDLQHQYLLESGLNRGIKGMLAKYILHKMRLWDQRTSNGVDHFIANSAFIAKRIWKTYRRDATVISPPVDLSVFTPHYEKENYYLAISRMVPYKKMDLIVASFAAMPDKQLIVIGDGPDFEKVKAKATRNITLLGFQPQSSLMYYLQRAKALVFAAEEDFGLVPVEAQACGTPVIAFQKGGALETVIGPDQPLPTGVFFKEQTIASILKAVHFFEKNIELFTAENCLTNAMRFSSVTFRANLIDYVNNKMAARA